jgi:chromatin structure-remodeling complex subunit RSC3/30
VKRRSTPADSDKLYEWTSKAPSVPVRVGPTQSPKDTDEPFPSSGFLGLTSHSSDFFEHLKHFGCQSLDDVSAAPVDPRDVEVGAQILSLLEHIPFYAEVLDHRFKLFEGTLFGPPFVREILARLKSLYQETVRGSNNANARQSRLVEWSKTVFENTATVIETHSAMTLPEYTSIVAPRWEIVGLIVGMAGRATYQISQNEPVLNWEDMPGKDKQGFRKIAMAVNDMCLQFSEKLGILSDPLVWATLQHCLFLADMHGPTGRSCSPL